MLDLSILVIKLCLEPLRHRGEVPYACLPLRQGVAKRIVLDHLVKEELQQILPTKLLELFGSKLGAGIVVSV